MKPVDTLFPINFSATMLADVWKCELYWFRQHCQKLSGQTRSGDLIAGGHLAKACEITRKAYFNEGIAEEAAIDLGKVYILESEDTNHTIKSNERLALRFEKYFQKFRLSSDVTPVLLEDGTYAIEYLFCYDLGIPHPEIEGQNICLKGKLDGLYQKPVMGRRGIYILDEKSTGALKRLADGTPDWAAQEQIFNTSGQFIAYNWASRKLGVTPDGTLVRIIPIMDTFEPAFEIILPINSYLLDAWEHSVRAKIQDLIDKYLYYKKNSVLPNRVFYPVYSDSCNAYAKPCFFKAGCLTAEGEEELASKCKQVVWVDKQEITLSDYKQRLKLIK